MLRRPLTNNVSNDNSNNQVPKFANMLKSVDSNVSLHYTIYRVFFCFFFLWESCINWLPNSWCDFRISLFPPEIKYCSWQWCNSKYCEYISRNYRFRQRLPQSVAYICQYTEKCQLQCKLILYNLSFFFLVRKLY